jgi:cystathionine beta-synthase
VVVLNPDSGRGYLSRVFNDQWMANYGFLTECDQCVGAVIGARGTMPQLLYVNPSHTVREAVAIMKANGVSQLPVCKNTPPFAAAEVSGAVDELALMDAAYRDPSLLETEVDKVMGPRLPTIGVGQAMSRAVEMLDSAPALLVLSGGRPLSVLTRTDMLSFLSTADHAALRAAAPRREEPDHG